MSPIITKLDCLNIKGDWKERELNYDNFKNVIIDFI
jgi:hypothetical protein